MMVANASHAATLEADIEAAMQDRGMSPRVDRQVSTPRAVLQGAFILAKAKDARKSPLTASTISTEHSSLRLFFGQPLRHCQPTRSC
jgi:TetR/AcrR family transcriptional repressor of nem operon